MDRAGVARTRSSARRRRLAPAVALLLCGVLAGAGTPAAVAATGASGSERAGTDEIAVPEPGAGWAWYFDELSAQPGAQSGGPYRGTDDLEMYWHGDLGPGAGSLVRQARAEGVGVHVVPVPHSFDEIWAAGLELGGALRDAGIEIWGVGPNRSHDTIEISGPELSVSPSLQAQARAIATDLFGDEYALAVVENEVVSLYTADVRPAPTD